MKVIVTVNNRFLGALVVCACWVSACFAAELEHTKAERIEQLTSHFMREKGVPGLSVAVATANEPCFAKGFGLADVENSVSATAQTKFRTGSVAKSITAVVILSLAEDGLIDLDSDVREYCPDYPRKRWPISTRQLLGHLAGVRHYKNRSESLTTDHFTGLKHALNAFKDDPLLHEPGTRFHYTTFGYNLLGSVAEGAAGKSFEVLLRERVWNPAGMANTVVDNHHAIILHRTRGYLRPSRAQWIFNAGRNLKPGELYNAPLHDTSMKIPGGGLLTTAPDLVQFAVAVNTGKLLKDETVRTMWTRQKKSDGTTTGYGLGWRLGGDSDRSIVWHTGGQAGTSTVLFMHPLSGTAIAIMCNLQYVKLYPLAAEVSGVVRPKVASAESSSKALDVLATPWRFEENR